jgi:hypothetical protein
MITRLHYSTRDLLRLALWLAPACTAARLLYLPQSRYWIQYGIMLALVASFVIAPCAAAGAMFDRFWLGMLCGLAVVLLIAAMLLSA